MDLPNPIVLVLAVAPSGRIVLTRDQRFPPNLWGLVAGYIERGERPEDAALRELREETGVNGADPVVLCGDYFGGSVIFCVRCSVSDADLNTEPGTLAELAVPTLERIVPNSPAFRLVARFLAGALR